LPGKRRKRATRNGVAPGIAFDPAPTTQRLRYLCEFLFAGDPYAMAQALGVCYRHFYTVYDGRCKLSIRMAGQVIAALNVRAEWLLNGTGPMLATDISEIRFHLAPTIRSSFPLKSADRFIRPETVCAAPSDNAAPEAVGDYSEAATALFKARVQNAPVLLLVGGTAAPAGPAMASFIRSGYAGAAGFTLQAAKQDASPALAAGELDLNNIARFAAAVGRGYGEAIASKIHSPRSPWPREHSALAAAYDNSLPIAVQVELGEIPEHFGPVHAGAELGAAVGSAAYVDQLVLADYLQKIDCHDAAVIICVGEAHRWLTALSRQSTLLRKIILADADTSAAQCFSQKAAQVIYIDNSACVFFRELLVAVQAAQAAGEMTGE
jgi:hypothetical protein